MSGLSPLVDTLLATRLAQRADLVPLKPEAQLAGPGAAAPLGEVANDVRLPSRAALERQLGPGLPGAGRRGDTGMAPSADTPVTWSAAARAISALMPGQSGAAPGRLVGGAALLPLSGLPPAPEMALALGRTVSQSGLFYESHLAQFAAGARPLAELAQEPQARLEPDLKRAPDVPGAAGPAQGPQGAGDAAPPGIHPEAVALVRQQLELLAQPAFRWSGQAWPGVPMDWDIQEERHEPAGGEAGAGRTWSTRLALRLPALGELEVRISLAGQALQVRLSAAEDAACGRLREAASELPARLRGLGLELAALQIATRRAPSPAPQALPPTRHAADNRPA